MTYEYKSVFKQELMDYEKMRLNSGYSISGLYSIRSFDAFLISNHYVNRFIAKEIIDLWAIQKETENKNTRNGRVSDVKQFCLYLNAIGIDAFIPNYHFSFQKSVPYVLTEKELIKLINEIDKLFENRKVRHKHYKFMVPVLVRLLYCTGLRNNEAINLKISNINDDRTLTVYNAKNSKDRLVYLSEDMYLLLKTYLNKRNVTINSEWLFPTGNPDKHINKTTLDSYFHDAVINANIGTHEHHPTPHSLRHTYVVHLVDQWVKDNKNVDDLMPYLSKQLGHTTTEETYYYYHMLHSSYEAIAQKNRNLFPEVAEYEE